MSTKSRPCSKRRILSLRGFDADGMMADAMLAQPGEADAGIRKLFENPAIATIHAHNAARGCFAAQDREELTWHACTGHRGA